MPTSPPHRSTRRSRTSTYVRSTRRRTRARASGRHPTFLRGRPERFGAAYLIALIALAVSAFACGGGSEEPDTDATPTPTEREVAVPSATPAPGSNEGDDPPPRDLVDLARRYQGIEDPPRTVELPPPSLGDVQTFEILELAGGGAVPASRSTADATLRAVSDHAYFFVERGFDISDGEIDDAAEVFEDEIWPIVTGAFGEPAIPGVDGDPRMVILHADLGALAGGYVSGADEYPRSVVPTSNEREMVYIDIELTPGSGAYTSVLAHELQHVIHSRLDGDEDSWVNEGLSEVAAGLVIDGGSFFGTFLAQPDTQLNAWAELEDSGVHYGASSLFFAYLLEQTGGAVGDLAGEPANGLDGVRAFLAASGEPRSVEGFVADWTVANLLDEAGTRYGYDDIDPEAPPTEELDGPDAGQGQVAQFAADYLEIDADDFDEATAFEFQGAPDVPVVGVPDEIDGEPVGAFWWSNRGDVIDSTLTRELDLTGVDAATLTFDLWYEIEESFDFAYVAVSQDGGDTWSALAGEHTTTDDPLRVSYGPGYTGVSGGGDEPVWVDEEIDLTPYAGATVLLRFEYITDDSTNLPGLAFDNIAVPETGYAGDGESEEGWERAGFRRVSAPLPQRFELRLVLFSGGPPVVDAIEPDADNRASVSLAGLGTEYDSAVIVIVGATDGTTEPARYRYALE